MNKWFMGLFIALLFTGIVSAQSTTTTTLRFQWDSNTETDLAGYGLYIDSAQDWTYDMCEDGIPPSPTAVVDFLAENLVVNINAPTIFVVDAYDTEGNRSGYSEPLVYIHCTPLADETQTLSCPAGQIGSITQKRSSSCSFNSMPVWGSWIQISNTCRVVSNCTPTTQTRTIKCDKWYYKGNITQQRTSICNSDGTTAWGPWVTVSSTCRPWYSR